MNPPPLPVSSLCSGGGSNKNLLGGWAGRDSALSLRASWRSPVLLPVADAAQCSAPSRMALEHLVVQVGIHRYRYMYTCIHVYLYIYVCVCMYIYILPVADAAQCSAPSRMALEHLVVQVGIHIYI